MENNGWINADIEKPELLDGDFSENVWGWDGENILVVSFGVEGAGWFWANAYGDVFGDTQFDADYDIKYWQPIIIPEPPERK
jgi:hypothetical protein